MGWFYGPYVSVAEKTAKARKAVEKLRKSGLDVKPIEAFKGALATTFWGKSWNDNLTKYADFENRVARGRSYVRNGFICHLEIVQGEIRAKVSGSSLYDVKISIKTLDPERWQAVCEKCSGHIGSLVELLQGKFSKEVMKIVCDPETGIFPSPKEISFRCSCPDWASMCKHVAAVLFAIGRRLDTEPELLFTLRGVDPADLLPATLDVTEGASESGLDVADMGALFDIDLDTGQTESLDGAADQPANRKDKKSASSSLLKKEKKPQAQTEAKTAKKQPAEKETKRGRGSSPSAGAAGTSKTGYLLYHTVRLTVQPKLTKAPSGLFTSDHPTGSGVKALRTFADLSQSDFARALMVTPATVKRWESEPGTIRLCMASVQALEELKKVLLANKIKGASHA